MRHRLMKTCINLQKMELLASVFGVDTYKDGKCATKARLKEFFHAGFGPSYARNETQLTARCVWLTIEKRIV